MALSHGGFGSVFLEPLRLVAPAFAVASVASCLRKDSTRSKRLAVPEVEDDDEDEAAEDVEDCTGEDVEK